jgi:dUTP pyrophosphatase
LAVKHSVDIAAGVIDPDYQGEVQVALVNQGKLPFTVKTGERIAQLLLEKADTPPS